MPERQCFYSLFPAALVVFGVMMMFVSVNKFIKILCCIIKFFKKNLQSLV